MLFTGVLVKGLLVVGVVVMFAKGVLKVVVVFEVRLVEFLSIYKMKLGKKRNVCCEYSARICTLHKIDICCDGTEKTSVLRRNLCNFACAFD